MTPEDVLSNLADGLRQSHQLIDKISGLTGLPFRPTWAQPMHEAWQEVNVWLGERALMQERIADLESALEQAGKRIAELQKQNTPPPIRGE